MRHGFPSIPAAAAGALLLLLSSAPLSAQLTAERAFRTGTWMLTAGGGGAAFSDFQRAQARPVARSTDMMDFERRVSARTSGTVGVSVAYWVSPHWGLRAGTAWVPTGFSVTNEESAERRLVDGTEQQPVYASLGVTLSDAVMLFRPAISFGRVAPYGIVGAGYVAYHTRGDDELPPEARERFRSGRWSGPAAVFGAGAAIPLQRRGLLLSFELTNHLVRAPLDGAGRGERFELNGVALEIDADPDSGTSDVGMSSNLRLVVGLTLPIH